MSSAFSGSAPLAMSINRAAAVASESSDAIADAN
jgi:hypothetical protein